MITPFGKTLRKLRIDNNEILFDMSKRLNVSPAFLSAVENGKRNVPAHWVDFLSESYHLSQEDKLQLRLSAAESVTFMKLNLSEANDIKRRAAMVFAREFDSMSEETVSEFLEMIKKRQKREDD